MNNPSPLESIFFAALEKQSALDRRLFLDEACADDGELRHRVEGMLAAQTEAGHFLETPALLNGALAELLTADAPGTVIGPYRLLEQIGEGGFGVVFLAEQDKPVRRQVALKIIKPGMDTRQVIARFEAERQALALMDHANIAKVLDAGTTGVGDRLQGTGGSEEKCASVLSPPSHPLSPHTGRPYFVMELVRGIPITEYCDQCNLTTRDRLELFITVCHAVQHAHQKGVIHRDIKPTNVLVAMQDGRPTPKIIDFGVAKAIGHRLTEKTLTIGFAQMVGTPLYMSPEQAELSPLGVDTRSDIYSLGVLLYELLTGTTPFDKERLHAVPYDELRRIIREDEPLSPSARISTLAVNLATTVAEHRRTDHRRLSQTIRGELDWIVMKCLDKDRNRRYETANALARDIGRYLADEAVQACPPSAAYRFRLFVRRNKAALIIAAVVVTSLVMTTIISVWQASQARRAEELAEQLLAAETQARQLATSTTELLTQMLHTASPAATKGADYSVRQMLDDFSQRLENQLSDQPAVEATIRTTIGEAYRHMEQHDRAEPHLKAALELRKRAFGPVSAEVADSLIDYAWCVGRVDYPRMEKLAREALAMLRSLNAPPDRNIRPLTALAFSIGTKDKTGAWRECIAQILAIESDSPRDQAEVARVLHWMSDRECALGNYSEAEHLARESLIRHREFDGENHPETAWCLNALAGALRGQQDLEGAEEMYRQALQIFRQHYEEYHFPVLHVSGNLLTLAMAKGHQSTIDQIRTCAEKALAHQTSDSPALYRSALIFLHLEQWEQAEQCYARIAELQKDDMQAWNFVALLRLHRRDAEGYRVACLEAIAQGEQLPGAYAQYLAAWSGLLGPESGIEMERVIMLANRARELEPNSSAYRQAVAIARYRAGKFHEAHDLLVECIEADSADESKQLNLLYSQLFLAMTQKRLDRPADAGRSLQVASTGVDAKLEDPDLAWDCQLTLKLWREEAKWVVLPADQQEIASHTPVRTPAQESTEPATD